MHAPSSLAHWRQIAKTRLAGISNQPLRDVDTLLQYALGLRRIQLYTDSDRALTSSESRDLEALLERLEHDEPLAYVIGQAEFWSMTLDVNPQVLIPRADTELLVERVLEALRPMSQARVLELGTGSGAIALALASERPHDTIVATDICESALGVATRNQSRLALKRSHANLVHFMRSDWYEALAGQHFDVIVSNPPYIDENDPHVATSVRQYEPAQALFSPSNGLADIGCIIQGAVTHLRENGRVFVEHGWRQHEPVTDLFLAHGFRSIRSHRDLGGHVRVTQAQRSETATSSEAPSDITV